MRRRVIAVLACMLVGAAVPGLGLAQDAPADPATLRSVAQRVDSIAGMKALYAACPADIFRSRQPFAHSGRQNTIGSKQACAADVLLCGQACVTAAQGDACYHLAKVFQDAADFAYLADPTDVAFENTARQLFSLGCALGNASACTNRGGGMRNFPVAGDRFATMAPKARESCLFATFDASCDAADPWGCAMLGQAYAGGEGTAVDAPRARAALQQACLLSTDQAFAACVFARNAEASLAGNALLQP